MYIYNNYVLSHSGDPHSSSEYKPGFLTDDELKQLVVEVNRNVYVCVFGSGLCVMHIIWYLEMEGSKNKIYI